MHTAVCVKALKYQGTQTDWPAVDLKPGFQSKVTGCQGTEAEFVSPAVDVQDIDLNSSVEFTCPTLDIRSSTPVPTSSTCLDEMDEMPPMETLHKEDADESYRPSFDESLE